MTVALLRDLDHAIERARAHGLAVDRLGYGVAIGCPNCRNGQDVICELVGGVVTVKTGGCPRCGCDTLDLNERLVAEVQPTGVALVAPSALQGADNPGCNPATPYRVASRLLHSTSPAAGGNQSEVAPVAPFALTLGEFIDKPRETRPALLADHDGRAIIGARSLVMLGARGGEGKTTLFVDAMVHLALGRDYLGFTVPASVRILMIENEGPEQLFAEKLAERVRLLSAADQQSVCDQVHVYAFDWGGFNLGDEKHLDRPVEEFTVPVPPWPPTTISNFSPPCTVKRPFASPPAPPLETS